MCGIAGMLADVHLERAHLAPVASAMADAIRHRGPDDSGVWTDPETGIALAHRRLSIIDVSPAGHQPMLSADGRYVIAYNGEIYNYADLRAELERDGTAPFWRGHSDTEVLLAAISAHGLERAISQVVGMFAFALWDRRERTLHLVRDRLGEKPLYYGWAGDSFVFGSELKALRAHPQWNAEIDRGALALLMRHNYIPAPYSIYRGISKLAPAQILTLRPGTREPKLATYWSAIYVAERGYASPFDAAQETLGGELESLLRDAVRRQMVADVPLGAFLSGGIDSSTVVALMQAQSSRPVKTFTIGFREAGYDEAQHAKAIARHLGTEHTELYVTSQQARDVIPRLPAIFDEPFADSSQIPTYLVSQLARGQVTVALSGDGGDELFAGYNRYLLSQRLWSRLNRAPVPLRKLAARMLTSIAPGRWNAALLPLLALAPKRYRVALPGDKLHKLAGILSHTSFESLYRELVSHWTDPTHVVHVDAEPPTALDASGRLALSDPVARMMLLDLITYLPGDILTKVDRAAMSVSLETRIPLLDHRVVEFAWKVPLACKIDHSGTKSLLRKVLYRHVPRELIDRPKMGFGVPIDEWLRGPLREWAEELLDESRLRREGYLNPEPIRMRWTEHVGGRRSWHYPLWNVLMFQSWLRQTHGG
jgi:asparagine synthase (glutamine-hydrolysing)